MLFVKRNEEDEKRWKDAKVLTAKEADEELQKLIKELEEERKKK